MTQQTPPPPPPPPHICSSPTLIHTALQPSHWSAGIMLFTDSIQGPIFKSQACSSYDQPLPAPWPCEPLGFSSV